MFKYVINVYGVQNVLKLVDLFRTLPPRRFSTGTLQSSKYTSAVLEALIPIFFSGGPLYIHVHVHFKSF